MSSPRRESDSEGDDYRSRRGVILNGHTKWVVGVVSAGIVALLGFFAVADRAEIIAKAQAADIKAQRAETGVIELKKDVEYIRRSVDEIKAELKK